MYNVHMRPCLFSLLWALASLCMSSQAVAHPHAWISVRTSVIVNDKGEAVALREHWLFDKMYTAYAVHDFNPNKNGKFGPKDILLLAQENVSNLKEYGYFTVVEDYKGNPIAFGIANNIESSLEEIETDEGSESQRRSLGKDILSRTKDYPSEAQEKIKGYVDALSNRTQLAMTFTVPFSVPQNIRSHALIYRIYDPTYYTDMSHFPKDSVRFVNEKNGEVTKTCQAKVELPKVDQSMIFSAAALDKNATAPKDLGYYFSEKVTLSCSQLK